MSFLYLYIQLMIWLCVETSSLWTLKAFVHRILASSVDVDVSNAFPFPVICLNPLFIAGVMTFHKVMPWCEPLFSFIIGCVWHSVGLIYTLETCVPYIWKILLMLVFWRLFHFHCHWSLFLSYYSERPFLQFPWLFFFIFYLFVVFVLFSEWSFIF